MKLGGTDELQSSVSINSDSIDLMTNMCTIMVYYEKCLTKIKMCRVGLELPDHMLLWFNGC